MNVSCDDEDEGETAQMKQNGIDETKKVVGKDEVMILSSSLPLLLQIRPH